MLLTGSEAASVRLVPTDVGVFKWHDELIKVERRLPLADAAKKAVLLSFTLGASALYFSFNRLSVGVNAYQTVFQLILFVGLVSFPLASMCALYYQQRKAHLSRCLYKAGYRMTEKGLLVADEPNPRMLIAGTNNSGE